MLRRSLSWLGVASVLAIALVSLRGASAAEKETIVTVVKEAGVPWFNILNQWLTEGAFALARIDPPSLARSDPQAPGEGAVRVG